MKILHFACLFACLSLGGQTPPATVATTTPIAEDYQAIAAHLDAGGDLYGIINLRGDVQRATLLLQELLDLLRKIYPEEMAKVPPIDLKVLENHFAFHDLQGLGISSLPLPDGRFRMKWFYRFDGPPSGIWNLYSPTAEPVGILPMTPPEASQVVEGNLHLDALRVVVRGIFAEVMGEGGAQLVDLQLAKKVPQTDVTFAQIISALSTRLSFHATYKRPSTGNSDDDTRLEVADFLAKLRGAGAICTRLRPFLEKQKDISVLESASSLVYGLNINGREVLLAIVEKSTGDLYLASSLAYWEHCRNLKTTLAETTEFQKMYAGLPAEVMVFNYNSPEYSQYMESILDNLLQNMLKDDLIAEDLAAMQQIVKKVVMHFLKPACSVMVAQDGGWLAISHLGVSGKDYALAVAAAFPTSLASVLAIQTYAHAKTAENNDKILNNLRAFVTAGQLYLQMHGTDRATYADLVGPGKYLEELKSVAGEDYTELVLEPGMNSIFVITKDGRVVEYTFAPD